jgi:hypothetical protein
MLGIGYERAVQDTSNWLLSAQLAALNQIDPFTLKLLNDAF